jgi:hypothetical protein
VRALDRPGDDKMTAVVGHDRDRVNGVHYNFCKPYAGGATNTPPRVRTMAEETR